MLGFMVSGLWFKVCYTISATNMHELGRNFVEEVIDVRETEAATVEEAAKGHHIQFKCQIRGWKEET